MKNRTGRIDERFTEQSKSLAVGEIYFCGCFGFIVCAFSIKKKNYFNLLVGFRKKVFFFISSPLYFVS